MRKKQEQGGFLHLLFMEEVLLLVALNVLLIREDSRHHLVHGREVLSSILSLL